ncbi:hypothetical protein NQ317_015339 [Molorchus minor]|uniref:THAP-type domain-containing protein n=1 Tax=Molorchus minor TaxID=1323400 RepID=A0ABQ9J2R1_9CUCU|nr:hypothetical protein NQ317_015339 [Molorchus minor]
MTGNRCAVYGCNNTFSTSKRCEGERQISMHVFPKFKDLVSQTIRKEWVTRCSRRDKFNPDTSRICSEHFTETNYERDLQHELLGLPLRKQFKKTAVPTIGIMKKIPPKSKSAGKRDERMAKRRRN